MKTKIILTFICLAFSLSGTLLAQEETGKITGTVVDAETGETLIGVNVVLQSDPSKGTATDLDGRYTIANLQPGTYALVVTYVSFTKQTITGVEVVAGESVKLDIILQPETEDLGDVVVTAEAVLDNEAGLLRQRQKSISFSDAISAETISSSGAGDAAGVMKKVVGASVVGGKYVYVRGLGDRYTSSHLNGVELPSTDPNRKSFQFDLFPSNLLENIVTLKTFTPDKPANFSGGLVNVSTKDIPERETFSFSYSTSYNSEATGKDLYLSRTSDTDLLASDDGYRAIPDVVENYNAQPDFELPSETQARFNEDAAVILDEYSSAFNSEMVPFQRTMPVGTSASLSYGNQAELFGNELGFTASLTYSRSAAGYESGNYGTWELVGNLTDETELTNSLNVSDAEGELQVDIGGLAGISYKLSDAHKLTGNFLYTKSATHEGRSLSGVWTEEAPDDTYRATVISYIERELQSYQLRGKHFFDWAANSTIEWSASFNSTTQDQPDLRYLGYIIRTTNEGEPFLSLPSALLPRPARFFRDLTEDNNHVQGDYSIPFNSFGGNEGKFKTGVFYQTTSRSLNEGRFEYNSGSRAPQSFNDYQDNLNGYFGYTGIVGEDGAGRPIFGNTLRNAFNPKNQYDAEQDIFAYYLMAELPLLDNWKVTGGIRREKTDFFLESADPDEQTGSLDDYDLLPSISTVVNLSENLNVRASYTNTIARPTFREKAPYTSFDFTLGNSFVGNPELESTLIKNSDFRVEWFPNPAEIVALSFFHKDLENPIERVILVDVNRTESVFNVPNAIVYGMEFEARKELGFITDALQNFSFSTNFSIVRSEVDIPEEELFNIRVSDPDASSTRQLNGQSPYLINVGLEYFSPTTGINVNSSYNYFGDRLTQVALGATPDVFERGYGTLDLIASKSFMNGLKVKTEFTNLLNPDVVFSHQLNGDEYIYQSYKKGVSISLGVSYSF